jgi:acetolactate synthase-1/2/3 large subunit
LCTPAREHRNVSTVIDTNGVYDMMCIGLHRVGSGSAPGPRALDLLDLSRPTPGFVKLAKGMGGAACRVHSVKGLADTCRGAFIEAGPRLIDTVVR